MDQAGVAAGKARRTRRRWLDAVCRRARRRLRLPQRRRKSSTSKPRFSWPGGRFRSKSSKAAGAPSRRPRSRRGVAGTFAAWHQHRDSQAQGRETEPGPGAARHRDQESPASSESRGTTRARELRGVGNGPSYTDSMPLEVAALPIGRRKLVQNHCRRKWQPGQPVRCRRSAAAAARG